ncbi:hypothetical protein [Hymenobacter rigui]|uniref:Uncharacterized protein n=1 Tax=Hymenobacter rigui TaxID=334424 RepID=A0A3R9P4S4_9BACT|nr:hypothetical protein [Hymenobacter rigui]RSK50158.1 hypothetical protein EI291_05760 [Hymenobacter rigui]
MTRASLLHIMDHVHGISDTEVRELEQLAAAFPYCQSAHVLLAKAAHDRGSMLASQRLRRAATYAADRDLLRQLLEQPAAAVTVSPTETASPNPDTVELQTSPADVVTVDTPLASATTSPVVAEPPVLQPTHEEPASLEVTPDLLQEAVTDSAEAAPLEITEAPEPPLHVAKAELEPATLTEVTAVSETAPPEAAAAVEVADDVLPAVAPPIRPPADGGISRFEFGLSQTTLSEPSGYHLPDLEAEQEDDELPTLSGLTATPPPAVTAPFRADADLGYSLGAGSRLGYDLQAHDGYTLDLPLDAFFEPDALLLAHLKAHKPKPAASSFDLINRFLKTQPRIKTPHGIPLPAEEQPDLSVRSTSSAPELASESLAKIMVRQGKKDKAIEIYERLMERQPEKKAYFAEQIQQLQQPSE